jgi:hypothetical protein
VKDVAKEQDEEEKDRKMMSDSVTITDSNFRDIMFTKPAWLVLFYSDDSDESWELHPSWERVVDELRELQVPPPCSPLRFFSRRVLIVSLGRGCCARGRRC